jgi:hypothetical protein
VNFLEFIPFLDANQKLIPERNKKELPMDTAKSFHLPEFTITGSTTLNKPRSQAK